MASFYILIASIIISSLSLIPFSASAVIPVSDNSWDTSWNGSVLTTPQGQSSPLTWTSRDGREYYAFINVPYAMPPVGARRFKLPVPAEPWEGVRTETEYKPECIQKEKYAPILISSGAESCLFLNLYVPKQILDVVGREKNYYPVLFYIHGGGFVNGNGSRYGADYFMDEDVILITFQYRLGPFGFMNSMDGTIPGNLALKDQVLALKWVQKYVVYYAGDPDLVTIFGNSAGAHCVNAHMLSPMSTGLFHRAISQSGALVCSSIMDTQPEVSIREIGQAFNCSTDNMTEYVDCLRNVDATDLALLQSQLPSLKFSLTIENVETEEEGNVFLSDYPSALYEQGNVNRVPWIVGINSAEFPPFALFKNIGLIGSLNSNWNDVAPGLMTYNPSAVNISIALKDFYFGDQEIGNDTIKEFIALYSDRMMDHCSKLSAEYQASYSDSYAYYLTKAPEKSYMDPEKEGFPEDDYGVAHADELQYLFYYNGYPYIPTDSEKYYAYSKMLVKIWTKFAATGNPNIFAEGGKEWKPLKPSENYIQWYKLDDSPEMVDTILPRMQLWDTFPKEDLYYN